MSAAYFHGDFAKCLVAEPLGDMRCCIAKSVPNRPMAAPSLGGPAVSRDWPSEI